MKDPAAVALGKRRMEKMNDDERRALSKLALDVRLSRKTKQDRRIMDRVHGRLATAILEAVDCLFEKLKGGAKLALVVHQGDALVMNPESKDFRILQGKDPDAVIGIYDKSAARSDVIEDVKYFPALERVLRG